MAGGTIALLRGEMGDSAAAPRLLSEASLTLSNSNG